MPNRLRYRNRVSFTTSFEGDFLREFSQKCIENGKDRNEVLKEFMIAYLESDIINPLNLPLVGAKEEGEQQQQGQEQLESEIECFLRLNPKIEHWIKILQRTNSPEQVGAVHGYGKRLAEISKVRLNQINSTIMKAR